MPIYEYRCNQCNHDFEFLVLGGDNDVVCPNCENKKVDRLMSACSYKTGGSSPLSSANTASSGCSSCSGGSCSTCH